MSTPAPPTMPSPEQQAAAFAAAMGGSGSSDDWERVPVFTGRVSKQPTEKVHIGGGIYKEVTVGPGNAAPGQEVQERVSAGQLAQEWFVMDGLDRNRYKDTFILMGLIDPKRAMDSDYSQIWIEYVRQLAKYNSANPNSMITVGDLITADLQRKEQADPGLADLMRTGKRTTTRTSTNIQKSSQLDANALADAAARSLLGRAATDEEKTSLLAAVNQLESANPEVTTSTQETDMYGEILGQTSTTSGGISATAREQMAREAAQASPEYGAYQASTTYMPTLMDMVYGKGY